MHAGTVAVGHRRQKAAAMQFISILSIAASALIVVVIYSVRLQRRAIATQERLALEHHEENQKRDRFYAPSVPDNAMPNNAFHSDGPRFARPAGERGR